MSSVRWTVLAAIAQGVPAHVLTASLYQRFSSSGGVDFADRLLSAMRREFGGHAELPAEKLGTPAPVTALQMLR